MESLFLFFLSFLQGDDDDDDDDDEEEEDCSPFW